MVVNDVKNCCINAGKVYSQSTECKCECHLRMQSILGRIEYCSKCVKKHTEKPMKEMKITELQKKCKCGKNSSCFATNCRGCVKCATEKPDLVEVSCELCGLKHTHIKTDATKKPMDWEIRFDDILDDWDENQYTSMEDRRLARRSNEKKRMIKQFIQDLLKEEKLIKVKQAYNIGKLEGKSEYKQKLIKRIKKIYQKAQRMEIGAYQALDEVEAVIRE